MTTSRAIVRHGNLFLQVLDQGVAAPGASDGPEERRVRRRQKCYQEHEGEEDEDGHALVAMRPTGRLLLFLPGRIWALIAYAGTNHRAPTAATDSGKRRIGIVEVMRCSLRPHSWRGWGWRGRRLVLHVHDAHGAHGHLLVGVHAHVAPHLDAVPAFGPARSVVGIAGLDAARHPIPERPGEIDGTAASRPLHRSLSAERPSSPFSYGLDSFTVQVLRSPP